MMSQRFEASERDLGWMWAELPAVRQPASGGGKKAPSGGEGGEAGTPSFARFLLRVWPLVGGVAGGGYTLPLLCIVL